jgi:hypothetical protein
MQVVSALEERHVSQQPEDVDQVDFIILSMFWRARGLFEGSRVLLENNLSEEGLILGRALFTESLRLMELERAGDKRGELVLGWLLASIQRDRGLVEEARRAGLGTDENEEEIEEVLENRESAITRHKSRKGIERTRRFPGDKDLAQRHGRSVDHWTYLLAHQMVHGSETAHAFKTRTTGEVIKVSLRSPDQIWADAVAGYCCRSMLLADRAACSILVREEPAVVEVLLRQAGALVSGPRSSG